MANEWDLRKAITAIARADTGPGGLVALHGGKTDPVVPWGDRAHVSPDGTVNRPITTLTLLPGRPSSGEPYDLLLELQLDIWVRGGERERAWAIADRLEALLTAPRLLAEGVDAAPTLRAREERPELDQGGVRVITRWELRFTRA
jgi:hypothetical protein